jgi:hypothetical protein
MGHREVTAVDTKVNVRFLHDECLWSWELVDGRTGSLIESAWQTGWLAYESPDEAHAAGADRLRSLAHGCYAC